MEIPGWRFRPVYEEGVDDDTLAGGIGHVPGTPAARRNGKCRARPRTEILIFAGLENTGRRRD